MYLFYTIALSGYALLIAPRILYQALRHRKYVGTMSERLGTLPPEVNPNHEQSIWIHAVSVGEVLASRTLIPGLRTRYPQYRLWMSTTTETGRAVAAGIREIDGLFYFPLDVPSVIRRVLDRVRPVLFLTVETELWPNLLRECAKRGVKTVLVNGRISDRSFPRYRVVRPFFRGVLAQLDRCCAQSTTSARRLVTLGAAPDRVTTTGNLKFDTLPASHPTDEDTVGAHEEVVRVDEPAFHAFLRRPVLMAGSTHPGEEAVVIDAFRSLRRRRPDLLLVLAPRHPERSSAVTDLAVTRGFETIRRSQLPVSRERSIAVIVLDTVGELTALYSIATVVFLGGSLVPVGGHNVLEPAAWGKPVVFGPHMQNFSEIASLFLENIAARQVTSGRDLGPVLSELFDDRSQRESLGLAARRLIAAERGATARNLEEIATVLPPYVDTSRCTAIVHD
ncbi:MAG: 3-deoxy-D-manno-octulosonic acid transferase [Acidobacteriota bacterium]|nr:3-deoxy-D-manno-octulosonic acid transferase [Acidobacteriota bacterium]